MGRLQPPLTASPAKGLRRVIPQHAASAVHAALRTDEGGTCVAMAHADGAVRRVFGQVPA